MKICHIITTLVYGGAERLLANFCNLHAASHSIDIIYFKEEPHLRAALDPSIRVHRVEMGKGFLRRLRAKVREIAPDIVHTHLGHGDLFGMLACTGLPVRRFCTMHNIAFKLSRADRAIWAAYWIYFKTIARDCQVVSISRCVEEHVRVRLGVPAARSHLIHNAIPAVRVEEGREELRARLGIGADRFTFLFVGRLAPQKSVDTLLHAAAAARASIPGLLVLLVGAGPQREELEALHARLGLGDSVRFCGTTAHPEHWFAAADAFVLPSVFEGLGIVVLEAFRASLPVLATDIEGPRELIRHGKNGLLFRPRQASELAELMVRIHGDAKLRVELGAEGNRDYLRDFTIGKYAERLDALYRSIGNPAA